MGNAPPTTRSPSLVKETEYRDNKELKVAVSSMRGWRPTMEDQHIIRLDLKGLPNHSVFAVLDGHGGSYCSCFVRQQFLSVFSSQPDLQQYTRLGPAIRASVPGVELLKTAMARTFVELDTMLRGTLKRHNKALKSGSTAVVVVLTPTHIVTANLGDSRAILRRHGGVVPLSFDHKPSNLPERLRIQKTGYVKNKRVNGDLAVSRAFGDFCHKPDRVVVTPDATVFPRSKEGDEFIVLACDGIWDVASNRECSKFVATLLSEGELDLRIICEDAIDTCFDRNSRDNMTIMIVALEGMKADYSNRARINSVFWETSRRAHSIAEGAVSTTTGAMQASGDIISNLAKTIVIPGMTKAAVN